MSDISLLHNYAVEYKDNLIPCKEGFTNIEGANSWINLLKEENGTKQPVR